MTVWQAGSNASTLAVCDKLQYPAAAAWDRAAPRIGYRLVVIYAGRVAISSCSVLAVPSSSHSALFTIHSLFLITLSSVMVYCWLVQLTFNPGKKEEVSQATTTPHHNIRTHTPTHNHTHAATIKNKLLTPAPSSHPQWIALWTAVAIHVRSFEPSCLSYELFQDEKEPDSVMILERYVTEQDLTVTHRQSAPFLTLRQRTEEAQLVKERSSRGYHESTIGFVSRQ